MDPVWVLFWSMLVLYAGFMAGWALKWYGGAGWSVLTVLAALSIGWVALLGRPCGTAAILLTFTAAGLLWGAYHWRGCQAASHFNEGNHEWSSFGSIDPYGWRATWSRWGFPDSEQMRMAEFREDLRGRVSLYTASAECVRPSRRSSSAKEK